MIFLGIHQIVIVVENQHSVRPIVRHRFVGCLDIASIPINNEINMYNSGHKGEGGDKNATNILHSFKQGKQETWEFWN